MVPPRIPKSRDDFEIAVVCALRLERDAMEAVMEEVPLLDNGDYQPLEPDNNSYTLGLLGGVPVVLALVPRAGSGDPSTTVWSNLRLSFKNVKLAFVVGLCGASPRTPVGSDVFLGDVIVSTQVIQGDLGTCYDDGTVRQDLPLKDVLAGVNFKASNFVDRISGGNTKRRMTITANASVTELLETPVNAKDFAYPGLQNDCLFPSEYRHKHRDPYPCSTCQKRTRPSEPVCLAAKCTDCSELGCDLNLCVLREREIADDFKATASFGFQEFQIHSGKMISSETSIKSAWHRDNITKNDNVIAFETEMGCNWGSLPTIVVKSVCNYADGHKNKQWHGFAALTAAACAEAILKEWVVSHSQPPSTATSTQKSILTVHTVPKDCLQALYVSEPEKDLIKARDRSAGRTAGTCAWMLEHPDYVSWHTKWGPQLLLVVGEPGIGKTSMATFLVERLSTEAEEEDSLFVYFFCNTMEPGRRTATAIIRSILYQILIRHPQLLEHAQRPFEAHGADVFEEFDTLWHIFLKVVQDYRLGKLTMLIDSLDNCELPSRKKLVRSLEDLLRKSPGKENRRLLVLTRPHAWNLGSCRKLNWLNVVTMSAASVNADIQRFIKAEVRSVANAKHWTDTTRQAVQSQLELKNGGTFLWISLALRAVAETNEDAVVRKLKRFSGSLQDIYTRVLRKIDPEDTEYVEYTLHFILGASRPLRITELALALYYRESQGRQGQPLPRDNVIEELKAAVRSCEQLLRIEGQGDRATVEFIHQSVKDFLIDEEAPMILPRFHTTEAKAIERLSKACAAYLHTPELRRVSFDVKRLIKIAKFRAGITPNHRESFIERKASHGDSMISAGPSESWSNAWSTADKVVVSNKQMALLQYSTSLWAGATYWKQVRALPLPIIDIVKLSSRSEDLLFETAKIAIAEGHDLIFRHLITILLRRLSLADGLHLFQAAIQYDESGVQPAPASKGRIFWNEELPDAEAIYHELQSRWSVLVHEAASAGLSDAVKFCIQHGDDITARDADNETPLHRAVRAGHYELVRILVKADSEKTTVLMANRAGELPLHISATAGLYHVAKALLRADSNKSSLFTQDLEGQTPLHRAASQGKPDVVEVLLEADVEKQTLTIQDRNERLPLHLAALAGSLSVSQMLLAHVFTLSARDRSGKTALDYAIDAAERSGEDAEHAAVAEYLRGESMIVLFGETDKFENEDSVTLVESTRPGRIRSLSL